MFKGIKQIEFDHLKTLNQSKVFLIEVNNLMD